MIRIGILGCAEIAFRRFLPALMENKEFECVCIAEEYDKSKLEQFEKEFGIKSAENFQAIIEDENIDAVYIPLPPALHFPYAKAALEHGKHVFVEKPSTISYEQTSELVEKPCITGKLYVPISCTDCRNPEIVKRGLGRGYPSDESFFWIPSSCSK